LNAIKAFEASARCGGFVAAASELGVTPAAISLQVRKLETFYGTSLFHRHARGVDLTEVGHAIFADCSNALTMLEATTGALVSSIAQARVIISCLPSLAQGWLVGNMAALAQLREDGSVELRSEDDPVDLDQGDLDIRITYGSRLYANHPHEALFTDRLMPVCSPEYLAASQINVSDPSSLNDLDLIHTWWSPSFNTYPGWVDWFAATGFPRTPRGGLSPCVNMPSLGISFALSGMGVALAHWSMAATHLERGDLVAPFDLSIPLPAPYAMVIARNAKRKPGVGQAAQWLRDLSAGLM
jgi:LysR family glycine cleavage system transcriptional activator